MKPLYIPLIALILFPVAFSTASMTLELPAEHDNSPLLNDEEITAYNKYLEARHAFAPTLYYTWQLNMAPDGLRASFNLNNELIMQQSDHDKINLELTLGRAASQEIEYVHPHTYLSVKFHLRSGNPEFHCTQSMIRTELRKAKKVSCLIL
jgi:hypothetical protein